MKAFFRAYGIFVFLFLFFSIIFGQRPGDKLIREGVDAFYNYEYQKSNEILSKAIQEFPDHPSVQVAWVASQWRFDESRLAIKSIYNNFERNLSRAESIYDSLLYVYPNHPEYLLYYGSAQGLKARIHLGQKKWLSTFYAAYNGFVTIQNAHELDSTLIDAFLPIGIVEYYAGMGNVFVRTAAELFGISPSKEEGLRKMELTALKGEWAWMEAMSVLSYLYQFFDINYERGLKFSKIIAEKYPNNFDFQIHYTQSLLQNNMLKDARIRLIEHEKKLNYLTKNYKNRYRSYVDFLWAHLNFKISEYDASLIYINKCIDNYSSELDVWLANAFLMRGNIYDQKKMRYQARMSYRKCISINNQTHAVSMAKIYLDEPFKK